MKRLILLLALLIGCGGALPLIISAVTTAGQLISTFNDIIQPQYQEANDNCAEQIEALAEGSSNLTATVAACDGLTDTYLALEQTVNELLAQKVPRSTPLEDKARERLKEYSDSYARYESVVR